MTDKPTPTDAELEALLLDKLPASKHYIRPVIEKMVAAMQAAIDKWGQPAQAGDAVARLEIGKTKGCVSLTHIAEPAAFQLQEGMYALYTAPQPVEREPLSAAQKQHIHNETGAGHALICLVESYLLDAHGIKGGQHGDATPQPTQPQAGAVPLPKFLALKFHARRDKKATVTLLFPGHEAADAWVRGIKGG